METANDIVYKDHVVRAVDSWSAAIRKEPYYSTQLARRFQKKINSIIPEKVHAAITSAVKHMTEAVCFGIGYTSMDPLANIPFQEAESKADGRIAFYAKTAAAEGALTGAGGILLGLADFPLWLTLKMKMLFEIASIYGYDATDYKERVFLLRIFELTFSGYDRKRELLDVVNNWEEQRRKMPDTLRHLTGERFNRNIATTLICQSFYNWYLV
ncbi:EcsC family protein [Chryseolinea sp. T2]|uniref:EcsC family protein n=1 Tax=Chryseolinea sp. T2 TaxID=3129255 RepID=UPI003FCE81A8